MVRGLIRRSALIAAAVACLVSSAAAQLITFENHTLDQQLKEFEFGWAGEGGPGLWRIVQDSTAVGGKALAQHARSRPCSPRDPSLDTPARQRATFARVANPGACSFRGCPSRIEGIV